MKKVTLPSSIPSRRGSHQNHPKIWTLTSYLFHQTDTPDPLSQLCTFHWLIHHFLLSLFFLISLVFKLPFFHLMDRYVPAWRDLSLVLFRRPTPWYREFEWIYKRHIILNKCGWESRLVLVGFRICGEISRLLKKLLPRIYQAKYCLTAFLSTQRNLYYILTDEKWMLKRRRVYLKRFN